MYKFHPIQTPENCMFLYPQPIIAVYADIFGYKSICMSFNQMNMNMDYLVMTFVQNSIR